MPNLKLTIFILVNLGLSQVDAARILCVYVLPAVSHQNVFRAYNQEMARRGHELVIITPMRYPPNEKPQGNITEIDFSDSFMSLLNGNMENVPVSKRGIITDMDSLTSAATGRQMLKFTMAQFDNPDVKKLIANRKNEKFDLIIVEALQYVSMIYSHFFEAPTILFSSLYGFTDHFETMGAVSRHPSMYPSVYRSNFKDLSFCDKLSSIYDELKLWYRLDVWDQIANEELQRVFGKDAVTVDKLKDRVDMLFLNAHAVMGNNRPVPPNVIYLGAGFHLQPVKELPKDIKDYLDGSKRGVVYVSLGSTVPTSMMGQDLLDAFLHAFSALPYDILWKLDQNNLPPEKVSKNVKTGPWFQQRDLLHHSNIKAFVTQGGFQSTEEAIDAQVPLVGVPVSGDQWYNTHRYNQLGIGVQLDSLTMNGDDLIKGITTVILDPSFKKNMKKLREVVYDRTQTPTEKAAWWSEYVIRHGGAKHLRSPAANMSYYEYFMVDLILCVASVVVVIVLIISVTLCFIINQFKGSKKKVKKH